MAIQRATRKQEHLITAMATIAQADTKMTGKPEAMRIAKVTAGPLTIATKVRAANKVSPMRRKVRRLVSQTVRRDPDRRTLKR